MERADVIILGGGPAGYAAAIRAGEKAIKAVYVHSHMDEETFDTDRIRQCCVGIREPDGTNVPSCAYNTLYRDRDQRFAAKPAAPLVTLGRGSRRSAIRCDRATRRA